MKKLLITLLLSAAAFAQQTQPVQADTVRTITFIKVDTLKTRAFRFTPLPPSTNRINGMAFGVGLGLFDQRPVTVNGFNLEVNPLAPFCLLFNNPDPERDDNDTLVATVNGLNISVMGFLNSAKINGVGISAMNVGLESNGFFVTGVYHSARQMDGFFISGIGNWSVSGRGVHLAAVNSSQDYKGLMLGAINEADYFKGVSIGAFNFSYKEMTGLQIGLFNEAKKCRGLQIGLWNVNEKRSMPIINW